MEQKPHTCRKCGQLRTFCVCAPCAVETVSDAPLYVNGADIIATTRQVREWQQMMRETARMDDIEEAIRLGVL